MEARGQVRNKWDKMLLAKHRETKGLFSSAGSPPTAPIAHGKQHPVESADGKEDHTERRGTGFPDLTLNVKTSLNVGDPSPEPLPKGALPRLPPSRLRAGDAAQRGRRVPDLQVCGSYSRDLSQKSIYSLLSVKSFMPECTYQGRYRARDRKQIPQFLTPPTTNAKAGRAGKGGGGGKDKQLFSPSSFRCRKAPSQKRRKKERGKGICLNFPASFFALPLKKGARLLFFSPTPKNGDGRGRRRGGDKVLMEKRGKERRGMNPIRRTPIAWERDSPIKTACEPVKLTFNANSLPDSSNPSTKIPSCFLI